MRLSREKGASLREHDVWNARSRRQLIVPLCNSVQGDVSSKAKVKEFYAKIAAKEDRVSLISRLSWSSVVDMTAGFRSTPS